VAYLTLNVLILCFFYVMLHRYFSALKQNEWCDEVHAELLPRIYCNLCVERLDSADAAARVARLTHFLSGCPRASASRAMWTRAVSLLRLSSKRYRDGWLWPICCANVLFQASVSLFVRWVLETVALIVHSGISPFCLQRLITGDNYKSCSSCCLSLQCRRLTRQLLNKSKKLNKFTW